MRGQSNAKHCVGFFFRCIQTHSFQSLAFHYVGSINVTCAKGPKSSDSTTMASPLSLSDLPEATLLSMLR